MDKDYFRQRSILVWLPFCLLVGCLATHFLIDGLFLLPAFGSSASSAQASNHLGDIDQQDDLVVPAPQMVSFSPQSIPLDFDWIALREKQAPSPIFHPPEN